MSNNNITSQKNHPIHKCECCNQYYDVTNNYPEIKESGNYICNDCWDIEG